MTDTERIKMALPLLQALADGKQLQFRMPNDEWRAMELDCDAVLEQPTSYRIAPDLPPRPSVEDVLNLRTDDGRILRLTGEYRPFKRGEYFVSEFSMSVNRGNVDGTDPKWILEPLPDHRTAIPDGYEIEEEPKRYDDIALFDDALVFLDGSWRLLSRLVPTVKDKDAPTFTLRKIAKPEPRYEPWTIETVPQSLCIRLKHSQVPEFRQHWIICGMNVEGVWHSHDHHISYKGLMRDFVQRDGSPCGVKQ